MSADIESRGIKYNENMKKMWSMNFGRKKRQFRETCYSIADPRLILMCRSI